MKKSILLLGSFFITSICFGRQTPAPLNVRSSDGTVSNYPYQLKFPNGDLTDNADGTMTVADSTTAINASAIIRTSTLQTGATFYVSSGTAVNFYASSATITHIFGTTTNDNATVGTYGEQVSTQTSSNVSFPGTGTYSDLVSITLTAGDWDVSAVGFATANGATVVTAAFAITTTQGNSASGIDNASNSINITPPTATTNISGTIPSVRASISATTTYYLKITSTFSVATPQCQGRLTARRMR